jgi:hypothetical protein
MIARGGQFTLLSLTESQVVPELAFVYSRGRFSVSAPSRGMLAGGGAVAGGVVVVVADVLAGGVRIVSAEFAGVLVAGGARRASAEAGCDCVSRAAWATRCAFRSI